MLSAGQAIPKVRTGTLPPLALTISGPGPRVQPRPVTTPRARPAPQMVRKVSKKRKKKNKMVPVFAGFVMLLLGGAGYMMYSQQRAEAAALAQKQQADSLRQARQRAAALARSRGRIVVMGMPEGVPVQIQGRAYQNGQVVTLDTGATYIATASAEGYQPLSLPVVVQAARTDTVVFNMVPQTAGSVVQTGGTPGTRIRPPADSNEVRFSVSPIYAEVYVDGVRVGAGRARAKLPVGSHQVRYTGQGCTAEEISLTVTKGEVQTLPLRQLTCQ
jgi:hypothetical protein